ncbi:MAG TPA: acid phosphatase [Terriglobia bacterium]|nr:acid phosphatase [Terriglobia bacterium]
MHKMLGPLAAVITVLLLAIKLGAADGDKPSHGHDPGDEAIARIDHIVVIYQENWSFDSLFGKFPGANGTANAVDGSGNLLMPQVSKSGVPLTTLPIVKGPDGQPDPRFPTNLPPRPYDSVPFLTQDASPGAPAGLTGDMIHRFYTELQQIDGGRNDKFASWSDNGGLTLSFIDAMNLPTGLLAQRYTLADNFFMAAFGGSFLNHQFLVAAAAPEWNQPLPQNAPNFVSQLDGSGAPIIDGNVTADTGPDGNHFAVNTTQPAQSPFRPGTPADQLLLPINDNHRFLAGGQPDPTYRPTIGDRLNEAGVSWKWYSGGWSDALAGQPRVDPFSGGFQFHHQAFGYYANFAPFNADGTPNPKTNSLLNPDAHLQDEDRFFADLAAGQLPAVSFIKPIGAANEHPGYAGLLQGMQHVASIVHAIQNSREWAHTLIIVTYDENGGFWDHVAPPTTNGVWGPGNRIPAVIISPFAKQKFVDHEEHNTLSILKTVETRFDLQPLNALDSAASSLTSALQPDAEPSVGDAFVERDADNPSKFVLVVVGTEDRDTISIVGGSETIVQFSSDKVNFLRTFSENISRIEVYAQGGADDITIAPSVTVPALVFGGDGDDEVRAGGGPVVFVGGAGRDRLEGGLAPAILIGGGGSDEIEGRSGADLLIGGRTNFDAHLTALRAILAEWSRTDIDYATKVAHLTGAITGGANAPYFLTSKTLIDDDEVDGLEGTASGANLWVARISPATHDRISGFTSGETILVP